MGPFQCFVSLTKHFYPQNVHRCLQGLLVNLHLCHHHLQNHPRNLLMYPLNSSFHMMPANLTFQYFKVFVLTLRCPSFQLLQIKDQF